MKQWFVAVVAVVTCAVPVRAADIRYWGLTPDGQRGQLEVDGQRIEVAVGDAVPGLGTAVSMNNDELVARRELSEAEQEQLRDQGAAVVGAKEAHLRNVATMVMPQ